MSGVWLAGQKSWVVEASGYPWVSGGVTHDAAKALDQDPKTFWNPQGLIKDYNHWHIILDLKEPYTLTTIGFSNYGDTTHDIAAFTLQRSDALNPYDWKDVTSNSNAKGGNGDFQEFGGFSAKSRYWRFLVTKTHSGYQPWLPNLQFYGSR